MTMVHRRKRLRAFSLVEVLVVLVILSLMTTVALFSYANYQRRQEAQSAAAVVQRMLVQARGRAIHLNRPQRVAIDFDNRSVWIDELNNSLTSTTPKVVPETSLGDNIILDRVRVGSDTHTTGVATVLFRPDGSSPLVTVSMRRSADDPALDENYTSVRHYPSSGEAQVLIGRRL